MRKIYKIIILCFLILSVFQFSKAQLADFTYTEFPVGAPYCEGVSLVFTDASTNATSWDWNFGTDALPQFSSQQNPGIVQFTSCGSHAVSLTINGGVNTVTYNIDIWCNPVACFNVLSDTICLGDVVSFINCSDAGGVGYTMSQLWDFGNGDTSNLSFPSHSYLVPNCYSVTLLVTNNHGCEDDTSIQNAVCVFSCNAVPDNIEKSLSIKIYPNPATDKVEIAFSSPTIVHSIEIFDLVGRKMMDDELLINNSNHYSLNTKNFPRGYYFIRIHTSDGSINRKIVLQ